MRQIIKILCVALILFNGSNILQAQEKQTEDYKEYQKAYNLVLDEQWVPAEKSITKFVQTFPKSDWKDDAEFWHCYTLEKQNRLSEAAACYEKFLKKNKGSKWYHNARTSLIKTVNQLPQPERTEYANRLQPLLQDDNEEIALTALYALQNTKDERVKARCLSLLKRAKSPSIRTRVMQILFQFDFDNEIIETFKKAVWEDPNYHVRSYAMTALLQKTRDNPNKFADAVKTINQILEEDPSPQIRSEALKTLIRHNATDAAPLLAKKAFHDKEIQQEALAAIPRLPEKERTDLLIKIIQTHTDLRMQREACIQLGRLHPQKALPLAKELAQKHNDIEMNMWVISILNQLPNGEGIPELIQIAQTHSLLNVRQRAIQILGYHTEDPRAHQALLDLADTK